MSDPFNIPKLIRQCIPPQKQIEIWDHIVDALTRVVPNEQVRKFIGAYRSDAALQSALGKALERAVQRFTAEYGDRELVRAVTQDTRFWDIPAVRSAFQEMIIRPSLYLRQEQSIISRSFSDVLPTVDPKRVDQAIYFFLHCIMEEIMSIPRLVELYQGPIQWARLKKTEQMVGLLRDQNQMMKDLVAITIQNQLSSMVPTSSILPKVHDNLPSHRGEFFGREEDLNRVLDLLQSRWPLISIEGLGGMGKTTLAIELAHYSLSGSQALLNPAFVYVVWVTAQGRPEQQLWLNEVLNTTARVLGYLPITQLPSEQIEQKKNEVHQLLRHYRTLLVIDNFETIKDPALEAWIYEVPEPSKVLITSRINHLSGARPITLKGLEDPEALELVRNQAQSLGLCSLEMASEATLLPLVEVTGGNPKAIEMALGYLAKGKSTLEEVIEHLHVASKSVNDLFDYLFDWVWNVMGRDAKQVLLIITFFPEAASKEALGAVSGLTDYYLKKAVVELVELRLLDIKEESVISSQYYTVHPLTRTFAGDKLSEEPEFAKQARLRWSKYYLDFANRHLAQERPEEHYWKTLIRGNVISLDQEWPNLRNLLVWTDQMEQDHMLVELMLALVHYMDTRFLYPERLIYARKAAEAAERSARKEDAAIFYIDALGWTLIEEEQLAEAEREIRKGMSLAESMSAENSNAIDLIALANAFLARILLAQEQIAEASTIIEKVIVVKCRPPIQIRISMIAGDIAREKKDHGEALRHYEQAHRIHLQYEGEEGGWDIYHRRWGLALLDNGNIEQAESLFSSILASEHHFVTMEMIYAKYALARVAHIKCEREKARRLAQEALSDLSRVATSNRLLNQLGDFLKSL